MKISKNILPMTLTVMVTFSIIMGTLLYAYQYTSSQSVSTNSSSTGNGGAPQGQFQKTDGNKSQGEFKGNTGTKPTGSPSNGNFQKSEN